MIFDLFSLITLFIIFKLPTGNSNLCFLSGKIINLLNKNLRIDSLTLVNKNEYIMIMIILPLFRIYRKCVYVNLCVCEFHSQFYLISCFHSFWIFENFLLNQIYSKLSNEIAKYTELNKDYLINSTKTRC